MRKYILIYYYPVALLFIGNPIAAQLVNAGKIIAYKKTAGGIEGRTTGAKFDIHAYGDNTIRVRLTRNKVFNSVCYALKDTAVPGYPVLIKDKGRQIEMSTAALDIVVEKEPFFRVIFKSKNGEVINEDKEGGSFGVNFQGEKVGIYKNLQEGERFVGLGEVLGNLDKRGMSFTLNNTDTYRYGDPRLSMYISIPFYIGIHHQQVYGLFLNNTFKSVFNFGQSAPFTSITADGGDADYFFFYDSSVAKIIDHYTAVTGKMPLPPLWSLGYQQSRCTYYPQDKVEWIAETFRSKKIPLDGIVLDADYQQEYQPFRTNLQRFPDLPALSAKLKKMGIELTASVYPGVKTDSTYDSYTEGLKKDVFIKYSNGDLFRTEIAPLKVVLPDYTNPAVRDWWVDRMKWMERNGISGYWNDMNEPAIGGSNLPDNLVFDFDGRKASSLEAKNVYGLLMARSSYEAAIKYRKNKRPFILTRAAFAGIQRYSAVWSGDNTASDEGLLSGVLLNSQMGLSGIAFTGPDLGGYIGDGSKDLFKRWMEAGVFSPYVRNHKEFLATANEPWSYGEEAEAVSKTYIGFRYRLMPYLYSKFYEASQYGTPVARSLCMDYPFDDKVYDHAYQYEFLFGDALLVTPMTSTENTKKVYLPPGEWYDLFTDDKQAGSTEIETSNPVYQIPVFVKASSIIPMQRLVQSTSETPSDTLVIHVYKGRLVNRFVYYEDAGEGFDYQQGVYNKRVIEYLPSEQKLVIGEQEGNYSSLFKQIKLVFHGFGNDLTNTSVNGRVVKIISDKQDGPLDPLEQLEDIYDRTYYNSLRAAQQIPLTGSVVIENNRLPVEIKW